MNSEYIVLFSSSLALVISLLVFALKVCFKSKCSDINLCCGLIKIHRNTNEEDTNISMTDIRTTVPNASSQV